MWELEQGRREGRTFLVVQPAKDLPTMLETRV